MKNMCSRLTSFIMSISSLEIITEPNEPFSNQKRRRRNHWPHSSLIESILTIEMKRISIDHLTFELFCVISRSSIIERRQSFYSKINEQCWRVRVHIHNFHSFISSSSDYTSHHIIIRSDIEGKSIGNASELKWRSIIFYSILFFFFKV